MRVNPTFTNEKTQERDFRDEEKIFLGSYIYIVDVEGRTNSVKVMKMFIIVLAIN